MAISSFSKALLASAVILTGGSFIAPTEAGAGQVQLHELLFNRKKRQELRQKRQNAKKPKVIRKVKKKAPVRKKIRRVSGPTYYTYKAPVMATVGYSALAAEKSTADTAVLGVPTMDFEAQRFAEAARTAPEGSISVEKSIADALTAHYSANPRFIWSRGSSVTAEAKELAKMLNGAAAHGLKPAHYAVTVPSDTFSFDAQVERSAELMKFEFQLSASAIRFAMDMKDGVINPNKISGYHDFSKDRLTAVEAMGKLAGDDMAATYVSSLIPQQPHYGVLQRELIALRASEDNSIVFPPKVFMKPGRDEDVLPLLMKAIDRKMRDETREKHSETIAGYDGVSTLYSNDIAELVRDVQRDLGLVPDGIVGPKTVARLGVESRQSKIDRVEMALERFRWHPESYGDRQVVINQPEFRVRYMEGGETKLAMRTVVGKPANQTNFFHDEIETVVFNPYWGVPQSIIVNEMLPRLQRDPGYLDRAGYVVTTQGGRKVASASVNWGKFAGPVPYNIRQKPGPRNALGELKILFPNKHAIYMHDTPAKNLFSRDSRAYSHGCVRLEDPRAMAAAVLGKDIDYVRSQLGGYEKGEKLANKVPVYVAYFTAWPNDAGKVEYHPDIYKRDSYLTKAIETVENARGNAS